MHTVQRSADIVHTLVHIVHTAVQTLLIAVHISVHIVNIAANTSVHIVHTSVMCTVYTLSVHCTHLCAHSVTFSTHCVV